MPVNHSSNSAGVRCSRNHYEPLRSAFGSFVGETTFIGNCNLMTEGPADQILFAGAARHLRSRGASELETLDLNNVTIVPASGAPHVPYLVYLARGRDVEKPAVIVMLDSDTEGDNAKKGILRGGPRRKQLLKPEFILQVGELAECDGLNGIAQWTKWWAANKLKYAPKPVSLRLGWPW